MNTFPANEQRISEVERGRSCNAIVPMPAGMTLSAGDTVLFAAPAQTASGREPSYVKGGDSVLVSLTDVTDLETTDPATGQALYQLTWRPFREGGPPETPKRAVRSHGSHRRGLTGQDA